MNFLKKLKKESAILLSSILILSSYNVSALDNGMFGTPMDDHNRPVEAIELYGAEKTCFGNNTVANVVTSAAGVLLNVELSTGAAVDWMLCADHNSTNLAVGSFRPSGASATTKLFPIFFHVDTATSGPKSLVGAGFTPTEFNNGITCFLSNGSNEACVKYLTRGRK